MRATAIKYKAGEDVAKAEKQNKKKKYCVQINMHQEKCKRQKSP